MRRLLIGGMHIHASFGNPDDTHLRHDRTSPVPAPAPRAIHLVAIQRWKPHWLQVLSPEPVQCPPAHRSSRSPVFSNRIRPTRRRLPAHATSSEMAANSGGTSAPAHAYPTVEIRICDTCSRVEDAVCIAALYASLIRMLLRQARADTLPPEPRTEIIAENRWLAQRYGVFAFLGDMHDGGRMDIDDYARGLIEQLADDARALGCEERITPRIRNHPRWQQCRPAG